MDSLDRSSAGDSNDLEVTRVVVTFEKDAKTGDSTYRSLMRVRIYCDKVVEPTPTIGNVYTVHLELRLSDG